MEFDYQNAEFLGSRYSDVTRNVMGHRHKHYELNFMTRGKTKMRLNESVFEYESYDFILIPPMVTHLLYESKYATFDNYVIWFGMKDQHPFTDKIIKLHDYDGEVQFLCSQIYKTYMASGMEKAELINLYLKAVLYHMRDGVILNTRRQLDDTHDLTEQVLKYISENIFRQRLSVKAVADRFSISPEHLSRKFKKDTGENLIQYMNELRIAEAKRLLESQNLTIKEISAGLFYTDPFYFSKSFKKLTGCSPSEYRKKNIK
ncbi:transcriptional regulator, AraC family [Marvinbryantia formatexigens DSM 14469]|uniref:Transcriptional regulator, AraC family n=1 Tax=Marvinbryantia formatexigens DSM 14469 TaxID=478749 RepID=C6LBG3_9FIRM|nr:AraC family transcriptional regulator [Marvinbryantia formatexigens]EET62294.1 transcriptional regulator, AraC family [Marvinbryantia formatexigens DSM 14469]UWO26395.1 AraC family transcriptional regulator [Marvinbryantia formatexigens DSM 14469]SDF82927.1 AraC-type DNA-binding protein [Marvinbryantia formatexigens]